MNGFFTKTHQHKARISSNQVKKYFIQFLCVVLTYLLIACTARNNDLTHTNRHIHQQLPPLPGDISLLLTLEMQAISKSMMELVPAIATADWQKISDIGSQIKQSYIMQHQLTDQQRQTMLRILPTDFKKIDFQFHQTAGKLAHAAEQHNRELINFYFYKLNEACSQCHSQYALVKFPGFIEPESPFEHTLHY